MHCFFCFASNESKRKILLRDAPTRKILIHYGITYLLLLCLLFLAYELYLPSTSLYTVCVYLCVTSSSIVLFSKTQHDAHARASSVPFFYWYKKTEATAFFPQCSGEGENNSALLQLVISSNVALLVAVYVCECVMRKKKK